MISKHQDDEDTYSVDLCGLAWNNDEHRVARLRGRQYHPIHIVPQRSCRGSRPFERRVDARDFPVSRQQKRRDPGELGCVLGRGVRENNDQVQRASWPGRSYPPPHDAAST